MLSEIETFLRKARKLASAGEKLAPRTRELYGKHLRLFVDWCKSKGITSWEAVTADQVEMYLDGTGWADSTQWSGICAIRRFYRWKFGETHPIVEITVTRKLGPPQRTLNRQQVDQLLPLFDTTRPKGIRDLAMVALMLDTGLRAAEVVGLDLEYIDLSEGLLWVEVKGGEWEPAAFFEYTISCLQRWMGVRETIAEPGVTAVFVSIGGTRPGTAITRDGLRAIFRKFSVDSEVGLVSPHDLRRTFCTLALSAGAPTRTVQVAGRWKNIKMVELYSRALRAKALHRWSPVNHVMGFKPKIQNE